MSFNKFKRGSIPTEQLNQRFNKGLVLRQLKALVDYTDRLMLDRDVEKIHKAWMLLDADPLLRPRYFNIDDVIKLSKPTRILVSEYSTMFIGDIEFENIKVTYHGDCHYAAPITKDVMKALGGAQIVSRMLLIGGVKFVADTLRSYTPKELDIYAEKYDATLKALDDYYLKELTTIKG